MTKENIYLRIPEILTEEDFTILACSGKVKIERIISKGHTSPATGWYDHVQNEWVMIVQGTASISFEDDEVVNLKQGDYLDIPAHKRHRVIKTSESPVTIWLAVHY